MAMPMEKAKDFKGTLKRLAGYLKPHHYKLFAVLIAAVLSTVFSIVSPKIMGLATTSLFDSFLTGNGVNFEYIALILLTLGGLYLISASFNYIQQFIMAGVAQKTVYAMREDINQKLSRLPLKYFDAHAHGDILSRVTNDVDNISTTLQQSITQLIASAVTLIGILVMMLIISPPMTAISLFILPLSFMVTKAVAVRSQKYFAGQQKKLGELNGHVEEMYTGHLLVKAFGREGESIERFNSINEELYDAGWKAQFISGIIMPLMMFINNIGYVLICVFGGILVTRGAIQIGDMQAFIQYSKQFTHPIAQTASIANILQSTAASAERVFELLDETEEIPDKAAATVIKLPRGEVRFKDVRFSYTEDIPLIENMNIDVATGQTVAIVGPTGAGKTTLVNLLMRFYDIGDGVITVDDVDIMDLKRGDLRGIFGMVLQDTWLFNGTIRNNIAYGRPGATDEDITNAAITANADHFIRTLPDGYDTVLNEEASNLSQGQKQLLTIARAILADPAILILDEATSSVDSRTELLIQKAMGALMKGRTIFVIAHRLSTIREADLILVMNEGRIIEKGNHKELLAKDGFYAELYNSQFAGISSVDKAV
ncbi:MAG: ABC transporter ATP-binding protein/permease, partial [Desulfobacterales bacterium]|nr:ABC transporter ATP-binding protein/permease [Desulfobacterales bacterium]